MLRSPSPASSPLRRRGEGVVRIDRAGFADRGEQEQIGSSRAVRDGASEVDLVFGGIVCDPTGDIVSADDRLHEPAGRAVVPELELVADELVVPVRALWRGDETMGPIDSLSSTTLCPCFSRLTDELDPGGQDAVPQHCLGVLLGEDLDAVDGEVAQARVRQSISGVPIALTEDFVHWSGEREPPEPEQLLAKRRAIGSEKADAASTPRSMRVPSTRMKAADAAMGVPTRRVDRVVWLIASLGKWKKN